MILQGPSQGKKICMGCFKKAKSFNAEELPIEVSFTKKNIKFVSYNPPKTWTHGNSKNLLGIWFGEEDDYEMEGECFCLAQGARTYMLKESSDRTFKVRKSKRGNYYYFDNETFEAEGYIDDGVIWEMRHRLEPPAQGYIMFASSRPEINIPYLLEKGSICHVSEMKSWL